jgi:glutamyl-tRNA synthetase
VASLEAIARRFCLQNAVQHGGRCEPAGLLGRILGAHPEFRKDPAAVRAALESEGAKVNALGVEAQKAALAEEAPELLDAKAKPKRSGLKELPNVKGPVVLRFAPNPNGPLSFGHSRGVSILAEYWRAYSKEAGGPGASILLRFDDTDPQVKPPLLDDKRGWDAYQMIQDDFAWLTGRNPDRIVVASDRIAVYQDAARDLIRAGGAYVCSCDAQAWRAMKERGEACVHRDAESNANLAAFADMVDGRTPKGGAVLRVKTDIQHRNVALRDWTAFRVVAADAVHPRERRGQIPRHHAWPLLDFQSAIEDHLQGVTHVIRGKDLMDSTRKQTYLYKHMGWTYPETLYWGRVSVHEFGKFSTSMMRRAIEAGKFTGWDDPRLPTLSALRRRGYDPGALRSFWVGLGLTEKDIAVSLANLDAENAKAVEPKAMRHFFVPDPATIQVRGIEGMEAHPLLHPGDPAAGTRTLKATPVIHVSGQDLAPRLRLKDLGNIDVEGTQARFTGTPLDRGIPIVQWLPAQDASPFVVLKPEFLQDGGDGADEEAAEAEDAPQEIEVPPLREIHGLVEKNALSRLGQVVQFERFGFVRIESEGRGIWLHT